MKNKNILILVLLFVMSFQVLHAYAIDMLDTHECQVSEYIDEFSFNLADEYKNDVCSIHAGFHHSFIITEYTYLTADKLIKELPQTFIKSYDYDATQNFLKPPRTV